MGLDNGIYIKKFKRDELKKVPKHVNIISQYNSEKDPDSVDLELCYWRKCWGIRQAIAEIIHTDENNLADGVIAQEDIPEIIHSLIEFLDEEYWNLYADSIWEYKEMKGALIAQIINLTWLYSYMENHDIEVEFYDSY